MSDMDDGPPIKPWSLPLLAIVLFGIGFGLLFASVYLKLTETQQSSTPLIVVSDGDPGFDLGGILVRVPRGSPVGPDWSCLELRKDDTERSCIVPVETTAPDLLSADEIDALVDKKVAEERAEINEDLQVQRQVPPEAEGPGLLFQLAALVTIGGGFAGAMRNRDRILSWLRRRLRLKAPAGKRRLPP